MRSFDLANAGWLFWGAVVERGSFVVLCCCLMFPDSGVDSANTPSYFRKPSSEYIFLDLIYSITPPPPPYLFFTQNLADSLKRVFPQVLIEKMQDLLWISCWLFKAVKCPDLGSSSICFLSDTLSIWLSLSVLPGGRGLHLGFAFHWFCCARYAQSIPGQLFEWKHNIIWNLVCKCQERIWQSYWLPLWERSLSDSVPCRIWEEEHLPHYVEQQTNLPGLHRFPWHKPGLRYFVTLESPYAKCYRSFN